MKNRIKGLALLVAFIILNIYSATGQKKYPNVIVILSDDMGFSDIGCYGGEIQTPNLDQLAAAGVRFSQFYNAARCCPTRASLLTGLYPHQAGIGFMTGKLGETEAYQGHIKKEVKTIANYFKEAGYDTYHVGKWHVGEEGNNTLPCDKGFDKAWMPMGRVNYWNTKRVYEDGKIRSVYKNEKKYLTDVEGDQAIKYLEQADKKANPFFMYLAFNAAHWPLHAKQEDIKKYRGKFKSGWQVLQNERIKRIDEIGLIEAIDVAEIKDRSVPAWSSIPSDDKFPGYNEVTSDKHDQDDWDLKMAVYAAQVDNMDQNIGRIINKLKETGVFENTIIIYLQDNGACAEGVGKDDPNEPGTAESYLAYGLPWANLSNTPFSMYKHFVHEGGISTPFIFHWPEGINKSDQGKIIKGSFGHLIDILPTCLDAAGYYDKERLSALEGQSLLPVIQYNEDNSNRTIYWEHEGNRAIRKGDWKLISRYSNDYRYFRSWGWQKKPRTKEWELYNIKNDRWELDEVSESYPEIVEEMKKDYTSWFEKVGALPRLEVIRNSKFKF